MAYIIFVDFFGQKNNSSCILGNDYFNKYPSISEIERLINIVNKTDTMATISERTISNVFSWMKIMEFQFEFDWNMFPGVQLTKASIGSG